MENIDGKLFEKFLKNSELPVFISDNEKFIYFNDNFVELTGYNKSDLEEMRLSQLFPDLNILGKIDDGKARVLTNNLELKIVNISRFLSSDNSSALFICRDETELNLKNIESKKNREFLDQIFSSLDDGVVVFDKDSKIINLNNAALKYGKNILKKIIERSLSKLVEDSSVVNDCFVLSEEYKGRNLYFSVNIRSILIQNLFEIYILVINDLTRERELSIELDKKRIILEEKLNIMDRELLLAKNIQSEITPNECMVTNRAFILTKLVTANSLGGDFFTTESMDKFDNIGIFDVSGHGVASSLIVMMLNSILSSNEVKNLESVSKLFLEIQNRFKNRIPGKHFIASTFCKLFDNNMFFASGGSYKPIIIRRNGVVEDLGENTFPIGLIPNPKFHQFSTTFEEEDIVVLLSDGVVESSNSKGELYKIERVFDILNLHKEKKPFEIYKNVLSDLNSFTGGIENCNDDITFMVVYLSKKRKYIKIESFDNLIKELPKKSSEDFAKIKSLIQFPVNLLKVPFKGEYIYKLELGRRVDMESDDYLVLDDSIVF
ncbi:MAG: hypothetical protein CR982_05100 [Candidatus Cloacimonadota bacterium]|nr:MAG: hypothetical protein CR982_05100 [Candidatus Cloacimonadota bacterium]PIE78796.1 MAG: hypothetical protein CSA15_05985 [Candidatus Delongbacteria bacterium]